MSSHEFDADFNTVWCSALWKDATLTPVPTLSRKAYATTENSLFAGTLSSSSGIRAVQSFEKRQDENNNTIISEMQMAVSLGEGINGIARTCHGGIIGVLLDEVTGQLAASVFGRYSIITASLNVQYKRRLETPAVVLCRAWVSSEEERRVVVSGTIENGEGKVYSVGEAVFAKLKQSVL